MRVRIRRAGPQDVDFIVTELKAFSRFFGTRRSLFEDEAYARQTITTLITSHVVLMAENDVPLGFIAGTLSPHPLNPKIRVLAELFWWVKPNSRGSRAALLLFEEFEDIGRKDADWIAFGLEAHSPVNERLLLRRGFQLRERNFLLEVG